MKKKKHLKKHMDLEALEKYHTEIDMCPEDFEVDVFHPYYMPRRIIKKKQKNYET